MIGLIWIEKIIFINTFLVSALVVIILLDVVVIIYDLDPQDQFKYLKVFQYLSFKELLVSHLKFSVYDSKPFIYELPNSYAVEAEYFNPILVNKVKQVIIWVVSTLLIFVPIILSLIVVKRKNLYI